MKSALLASFALAAALLTSSCDKGADAGKSSSSGSAAPQSEAAFVSAYRKALETSDTKTLDSFYVNDGTPEEIVEFFKMMRDVPPGATLVDVTLETPTADELANFDTATPMPDGKSYKLAIKPTKKLVVKTKTEGADGKSTSTATMPVAEKDGKLIIPLPVPAA